MDTKGPKAGEDLWDWVAQQLGISHVPEPIQRHLIGDGYGAQHLRNEPNELEETLDAVKLWLRTWSELEGHWNEEFFVGDRRRRSTDLPASRDANADLAPASEVEMEYARACGAYLATIAAGSKEVRNFQADLFGGALLSVEQANEFLQSPSLRILTRADLASHGIPVLGPRAKIIIHEETVTGDSPGGKQLEREVTLRVEWWDAVHEEHRTCDVTRRCKESISMWRIWGESILDRDRPDRHVPEDAIWPGSIHDALLDLARTLSRSYDWEDQDALWFLLVGATPAISLVRGEMAYLRSTGLKFPHLVYACPTITFEPRTPMETLIRTCRQMQQWLLEGQENRLPSKRNLVLFRFVLALREQSESTLTWKQLMSRWNETYPEWRYRDRRLIARDYQRAREAVVNPHYDWWYRRQRQRQALKNSQEEK